MYFGEVGANGGTHKPKRGVMKYAKTGRGRMGGGVEVKMEAFGNKMVVKTATEERNVTTEAGFFEN